jgi:hypothetical protein
MSQIYYLSPRSKNSTMCMHQSLLSEATLFANTLLSSRNKHVSPQKHHFIYGRQFQWLNPSNDGDDDSGDQPHFNAPWFKDFPHLTFNFNNLIVKYSPFKIFQSLVFKSTSTPSVGVSVSRNKSLHDFASCIALQCWFTVDINLLQSRSEVPVPQWTIINSSADVTNQQ